MGVPIRHGRDLSDEDVTARIQQLAFEPVVVNETAAGYMMGNPNAKVKLVEVGALTCPHCREFDEKGVPNLVDKYVKTGQVSWEFRNYMLHGLDVSATLIARCNGLKSFFPLVRAFYKDQPTWIGKISATPEREVSW